MHAGTGVAGLAPGRVDERSLRLLRRALLGSLALHALLLAALPWLREAGPLRAPAPPPLVAYLAKPPPPPPPPPPPRVEPVPPKPVAAPKPAPTPPAPQPAPAPMLEPLRPAPSAAPAVAVPPPVVAPPASPLAPTLAAPPVAARSDAAAPAATPANAGPDPGSVSRFRMELMTLARRYKRYPRIAQDNGWEGRVEVRIAYAESGALSSITVKKGAGRQVLDDEALAMIRNAQAQLVVPPSLRGKAFVLEIPVDFFLRDDAR